MLYLIHCGSLPRFSNPHTNRHMLINKHHHFSNPINHVLLHGIIHQSSSTFAYLCFLKSLSSFPSSLYESPGSSTTLLFLHPFCISYILVKFSLCLKTLSLLSLTCGLPEMNYLCWYGSVFILPLLVKLIFFCVENSRFLGR